MHIVLFPESPWPPDRSTATQAAISLGAGSLLCLTEGLMFTGGGKTGIWSVGIPANDDQRVRAFVTYENGHGRTVALWSPDRTVACAVYERLVVQGEAVGMKSHAQGELLCHATPLRHFAGILSDGALLSLNELVRTGKPVTTLRLQVGEPSDYLDYVELGSVASEAPERVVATRGKGIVDVSSDDHYAPGARLYFEARAVAELRGACYDGLHELKVYRRLPLDCSIAIVFPSRTVLDSFTIRETYPALADRCITVSQRVEWTPRQYVADANACVGRLLRGLRS